MFANVIWVSGVGWRARHWGNLRQGRGTERCEDGRFVHTQTILGLYDERREKLMFCARYLYMLSL